MGIYHKNASERALLLNPLESFHYKNALERVYYRNTVVNSYIFFIAYLLKCSEFNNMLVGNNTASNFCSSFRPQNLGGTLAHFFQRENNKTHSCYPINLNGQIRKMYSDWLFTLKPVQQEKNCVFNSAATTSWGYHKSFLAVSASSPLHVSNQKRRKPCFEKARCTCVTRLSHPNIFPVRFPSSINTNTLESALL